MNTNYKNRLCFLWQHSKGINKEIEYKLNKYNYMDYKLFVKTIKSRIDIITEYINNFVEVESNHTEEKENILKYNMNGFISTKVRKNKYLMALDCDSVSHKDYAIRELTRQNIKHFCIESSSKSFWIICDYINTVDKVTQKMTEIPGVDQKYIECAKASNKIVLRAFPKYNSVPIFDDVSTFNSNSHFERWILDFKNYWTANHIEYIQNQMFCGLL